MLGFRFTFNQPHQKAWWTDGSLDWFWAACEKAGLPIGLLAGGNMAALAKIAERHPRLKLHIDHLGRSGGGGGVTDDAAFADLPDMLALAKYPNVGVKMSGAPSYSSQPYPYKNIHGYLRQIRGVRPRALVLGHRHHPHAVLVSAMRDDVYRGAAVAEGPRPRAGDGRGRRRLARLEAPRRCLIARRRGMAGPIGDRLAINDLFVAVRAGAVIFTTPAGRPHRHALSVAGASATVSIPKRPASPPSIHEPVRALNPFMARVNDHYLNSVRAISSPSDRQERVKTFQKTAHPDARIIRLGIGDVTRRAARRGARLARGRGRDGGGGDLSRLTGAGVRIPRRADRRKRLRRARSEGGHGRDLSSATAPRATARTSRRSSRRIQWWP